MKKILEHIRNLFVTRTFLNRRLHQETNSIIEKLEEYEKKTKEKDIFNMKENVTYVNVKKILLIVGITLGSLIVIFAAVAFFKNYNFMTSKGRGVNCKNHLSPTAIIGSWRNSNCFFTSCDFSISSFIP